MRPIHEIAREIKASWRPMYFGAVPYVDAMQALNLPSDNYGYDSAQSILLYFLGNAHTWRGETARRVKAEIKALLKAR